MIKHFFRFKLWMTGHLKLRYREQTVRFLLGKTDQPPQRHMSIDLIGANVIFR